MPSVRSFQYASTSRPIAIGAPKASCLTPAPSERVGECRSDAHEQVRGLEPGRGAEQGAGESGVGDPSWRERARDEERCGEDQHHRRVVGHGRQPRRLWEELLGPLLPIALDEERDRRRTARAPRAVRPSSREASRRCGWRFRRRTGGAIGPRTKTFRTTRAGSTCTYVGPVSHVMGAWTRGQR